MSRLWPPAMRARWSPGSGNSVARPTQIQPAWKNRSSSHPSIPALMYAGAGRVRTRSLTESRNRRAARVRLRARLTQCASARDRKTQRGGRVSETEPEHSIGVDLRVLECDLNREAIDHRREADREIVDIHRLELAARHALRHDSRDRLAPVLIELPTVLRDSRVAGRNRPQVEPEHPGRLIGIIGVPGHAAQLEEAQEFSCRS